MPFLSSIMMTSASDISISTTTLSGWTTLRRPRVARLLCEIHRPCDPTGHKGLELYNIQVARIIWSDTACINSVQMQYLQLHGRLPNLTPDHWLGSTSTSMSLWDTPCSGSVPRGSSGCSNFQRILWPLKACSINGQALWVLIKRCKDTGSACLPIHRMWTMLACQTHNRTTRPEDSVQNVEYLHIRGQPSVQPGFFFFFFRCSRVRWSA